MKIDGAGEEEHHVVVSEGAWDGELSVWAGDGTHGDYAWGRNLEVRSTGLGPDNLFEAALSCASAPSSAPIHRPTSRLARVGGAPAIASLDAQAAAARRWRRC